MSRNIPRLISKMEDSILGWVVVNRRRLVRYFLAIGLLFILSLIPYINLLFSRTFVVFLLFFLFLIIFRVRVKVLGFITMSLLLMTVPLILLKEISTAERIAEFVYGVAALASVKLILERPQNR